MGEACVQSLVNDGAKTAILDFDKEKGMRIADELLESVIFCKTDVVDEKSVLRAIETTLASFGAIHVVINCAGVATPARVLGKEGPMPAEVFNRIIQINLVGIMNVIRLAAEKMINNIPNEDGEKGVIINTASIAAFEGQIGQAGYSASKAAIIGMTLPVAREFADYGIRVLTIAPGLFETPMLASLPEKANASLLQNIPFPKRLAKPSEFAQLARHIIGNPILNGETIRLDSCIRMGSK